MQGRREPRLTDDVSGTRLAAHLQALNCVTSPAGAGGRGPRKRLAAVHKAPSDGLAPPLGARLLSRPFSFPGSLPPRAPSVPSALLNTLLLSWPNCHPGSTRVSSP